MLSKLNYIKQFVQQLHPLTKGILTYSVLWPTACTLQQTIAGKRWDTYDWLKTARYGLFGGFFVAPTLFCWFRVSTAMWPQTNLRIGLTKAIVEQFSYGPISNVCFFFGMSLLEMKSMTEARAEVLEKFLPTYKTAICYWPIIQTINFSLIPERNRILFVSICSVIWTTFLAYIKQLELNEQSKLKVLQEDEHNQN